MHLSPGESWLLLVAIALAVVAVVGIMGIIDDGLDYWRNERQARAQRRLALRENINALIVELSEDDDDSPLLDRALQDSIVEYRVLCGR